MHDTDLDTNDMSDEDVCDYLIYISGFLRAKGARNASHVTWNAAIRIYRACEKITDLSHKLAERNEAEELKEDA